MSYFKGLGIVVLFIFLNGCEAIWSFSDNLKLPPSYSQELRIVALQHPFAYHTHLKNGLEKDLIEKFAKDVGYRIKWSMVRNENDALTTLKNNKADLAIGRFNLNQIDEMDFLKTIPYEESSYTHICKSEKSRPIKIIHLKKYNFNKKSFQKIEDNDDTCGKLEKNEADFFIRLNPKLQIIEINNTQFPIGFVLNKKSGLTQKLLTNWLQKVSRSKLLKQTLDRYHGHLNEVESSDSHKLIRLSQTTLHELKPLFKQAAKEFNLPWQLVAAVAYQESHWDNSAVSFTGVRGMMMLTEDTAEFVGIQDRTDIRQSIWGGAKYLRYLLDKQPKSIHQKDRLTFALATYNVGRAHFIDAQRLAQRLNQDPLSWTDLKRILPLLSYEEFFMTLQYGEARGQEPVTYANRINNFYEMLTLL